MQVDLSGPAWKHLLDECIRRYLESAQSNLPFPTHAECTYEDGRVTLRSRGREVGVFDVLRIHLDDEIRFTLRDETVYPSPTIFIQPKRGRYAR
jgi:hypothetical protein